MVSFSSRFLYVYLPSISPHVWKFQFSVKNRIKTSDTIFLIHPNRWVIDLIIKRTKPWGCIVNTLETVVWVKIQAAMLRDIKFSISKSRGLWFFICNSLFFKAALKTLLFSRILCQVRAFYELFPIPLQVSITKTMEMWEKWPSGEEHFVLNILCQFAFFCW